MQKQVKKPQQTNKTPNQETNSFMLFSTFLGKILISKFYYKALILKSVRHDLKDLNLTFPCFRHSLKSCNLAFLFSDLYKNSLQLQFSKWLRFTFQFIAYQEDSSVSPRWNILHQKTAVYPLPTFLIHELLTSQREGQYGERRVLKNL